MSGVRLSGCALCVVLGVGCADGSPRGPSTREVTSGPGDGGAADDATSADDAGLPATTSVCTSASTWTRANTGDEVMNPGKACITCHASTPPGSTGHGPLFSIAGTVYPTLHEPDLCNGVNGTLGTAPVVEITDATGRLFRLMPNASGNFFLTDSVSFPIHARVLYNGDEWEMLGPQMSGDCNGCHTETGLGGAPGRILRP